MNVLLRLILNLYYENADVCDYLYGRLKKRPVKLLFSVVKAGYLVVYLD